MDMVKKRYVVLGLLCAMYILSFFHRLCPAVIALDLSADLNITPADVGFLSGATMLTYGFMQLPSGILADALGGKKAVVLLGLLASAMALVFAMSGNFGLMVGSRLVMGIGLAITVPALALLATWFPPHMYARASSVLLCCGGLGGILAAPPLAALSDEFGWRVAIICFAALTLVVTAAIAFGLTAPPQNKEKKKSTVKELLTGVKTVVTSARFWPLALWQMFAAGTYFAMASLWWGPYLMQGCGLSKMESSMVLTAAALTMVIGHPVMGWLSDMVFKARKAPLMGLSVIGIAASASMVWFTGEMSGYMLIVQAILFMLGFTTGAPLIFTMAKESFPLHVAGTAIGCLNMFYPIWAAVVQSIYATVLEAGGPDSVAAFSGASWVILINSIICLGFCFFMKETWQENP